MDEPIPVEAEVIDTELMVVDRVKPVLDIVMEEVNETSTKMVKDYPEPVAIKDTDTYKFYKKCRTELRKELKDIDDSRKRFKKPFADAVKTIDDRYKDALAQADALEQGYKAALTDWEQAKRQERHDMLLQHFNDGAADIADHIDFELLDARHQSGSDSWYAASCGDEKARLMLKSDVNAIYRDIDTIDMMNFPDDAERVQLIADYYATLNLQDAIARSKERQAAAAREAERLKRIKADEEANFQRLQQLQSTPQTAPEPPAPQERFTYQFTVEVTEAEKQALIEFMKSHGIHGTATRR